jgi:hypothetical protein
MLNADAQSGAMLPRDVDGRTVAEVYHYWSGVADAYRALHAELNIREGRS